MKPTRIRMLLGVALVTALLTWAVLRAHDKWRGGYPDVSWITPAALWLFAAAMVVTVVAVRPRLLRKPGAKPLDPLVAARFAALALASSRVGAAVVGAYIGFAVALIGELDTPYGRRRAVYAALTAVAAVVVVAAGLALERACRIREGDRDARGDRGLGSPA